MFFGDKKKIGSALILGVSPAKKPGGSEDSEDYEEMLSMASEDLMEAVENKDAGMFKSAMKDFVEILRMEHEEGEKSEKEDEKKETRHPAPQEGYRFSQQSYRHRVPERHRTTGQ